MRAGDTPAVVDREERCDRGRLGLKDALRLTRRQLPATPVQTVEQLEARDATAIARVVCLEAVAADDTIEVTDALALPRHTAFDGRQRGVDGRRRARRALNLALGVGAGARREAVDDAVERGAAHPCGRDLGGVHGLGISHEEARRRRRTTQSERDRRGGDGAAAHLAQPSPGRGPRQLMRAQSRPITSVASIASTLTPNARHRVTNSFWCGNPIDGSFPLGVQASIGVSEG